MKLVVGYSAENTEKLRAILACVEFSVGAKTQKRSTLPQPQPRQVTRLIYLDLAIRAGPPH